MFTKFKEMLATLQVSISFHEILELMPKFAKFMKALLKRTKEKVDKRIGEHDKERGDGSTSGIATKDERYEKVHHHLYHWWSKDPTCFM